MFAHHVDEEVAAAQIANAVASRHADLRRYRDD
jgi:hypothetical protein